MNTDFNSIAKSRAKYYLKGSPVQFTCVELLKTQEQQNVAVTLTFKNIAPAVLESLNIVFSCKDGNGQVVAQEKFTYKDLQVQAGQVFGSDDAVFVSNTPISNVEVKIVSAVYGGKLHNLTNCQIIPLPALRPLSVQSKQMLDNMLNITHSNYVPCNVQDGWVCTCGAFNYNTGTSAQICSECMLDKAGLFNSAKTVLMGAANGNFDQMNVNDQYSNINDEQLHTKDFENLLPPEDIIYDGVNQYTNNDDSYIQQQQATQQNKKSDKPYLMSNETADKIFKFTPVITLGVLASYFVILLLLNLLLG